MTQTIEESRAQLIANLQERAEELAQLNRIAIALTSEFDLQRLLQMITDAARKVTAAEYAAFFLIPEIAGENVDLPVNKVIFNLAAISGATPAIEKHFRHLGPVEGIGVLQPVFWEGESIVVDDVHEDPRYIGVPRGHIPVRSFLGVQLRARDGSILGAFLIGDTRPCRFSARHVELIEALSAQAAVAIHNAQLVARERRAMEEHAAKLEREVRERTAELERRNQELSKIATELQEGGFVSILYALIQNLRETSSIEIDLVVAECAVPLPSHIENTLFTIAQEALSNARRHALATIVIVTVQVTSEQAALVVQDNGIGLSTQALQAYRNNTMHLGLKGMHHRVEELGGQFLLANGEEGGLIVKAVIPL